MKTLSQLLVDINSHIDLEATLPSGTELTTRVNYINQAIYDANAIAKLKEFELVYAGPVASAVTLPQNFKETTDSIKQLNSSGVWEDFLLISPDESFDYTSGSKYAYITGNPASRYMLNLGGFTSGATLSFSYQRYPSGMATLTDVCELSDPEYVVLQASAYVLQGRDDARFPILNAQAQAKLQNMVGNDQVKQIGSINEVRKIGASAYSIGT